MYYWNYYYAYIYTYRKRGSETESERVIERERDRERERERESERERETGRAKERERETAMMGTVVGDVGFIGASPFAVVRIPAFIYKIDRVLEPRPSGQEGDSNTFNMIQSN